MNEENKCSYYNIVMVIPHNIYVQMQYRMYLVFKIIYEYVLERIIKRRTPHIKR